MSVPSAVAGLEQRADAARLLLFRVEGRTLLLNGDDPMSAKCMGRDGVDGLECVHRAGGTVCAQDEASSAVFGMPKAAIEAGIVDVILRLTSISRRIADAVALS